LEWLVPGSVWATDFSQSPVPIDDGIRDVLAVRDLASHNQLLLLPAPRADALTAACALEHLFATCGPPLILKDDNGPPFLSDLLAGLLDRWGVSQLLSPRYYPQYNGSAEAGFGPSKTRIFFEAARHGRFDHWISDDVEAARQLANCASRPHGSAGPTPQQAWDARTPVTPPQPRPSASPSTTTPASSASSWAWRPTSPWTIPPAPPWRGKPSAELSKDSAIFNVGGGELPHPLSRRFRPSFPEGHTGPR